MAANRGFKSRDSKSRLRLIDAAYDLLAEEGYPAISARRIAEKAGLKPQLVHYYFRSMEELVIAVFQRTTAAYFHLHDEALSSPYPLRALWELNSNLPEAKRMTEFISLSKQYGALRSEMRQTGERFRHIQIEAAERVFAERVMDDPPLSPIGVTMLMSAIARNIVIEREVGMSLAHAELIRFVSALLDRFEPVDAPVQQDEMIHRAT